MNRICLLLSLPFLFAFKFHPMSQSIELSEKQKSAQFWLENDSNEKLGIELTVRSREMDSGGKESLPETKAITVFPPQVIIPPNEKKAVRVTYTGEDVNTEKAFRVIAEQLPVKVDEKTKKRSGIQMLMKYVAALYVTPKDAHASLEVASVTKKDKKLIITVTNKGNKHQILANPVLIIKSSGTKFELKAKELEGFTGENVLANSTRTFMVKSSLTLAADAKATLQIED